MKTFAPVPGVAGGPEPVTSDLPATDGTVGIYSGFDVLPLSFEAADARTACADFGHYFTSEHEDGRRCWRCDVEAEAVAHG